MFCDHIFCDEYEIQQTMSGVKYNYEEDDFQKIYNDHILPIWSYLQLLSHPTYLQLLLKQAKINEILNKYFNYHKLAGRKVSGPLHTVQR